MKSPCCGLETIVTNVRSTRGATQRRRRLECSRCGKRWTSYEECAKYHFLNYATMQCELKRKSAKAAFLDWIGSIPPETLLKVDRIMHMEERSG